MRDKGLILSTVAITGAGGYIARQLILSLENQKWCRRILGTDIVEPEVQAGKLEFRNHDILQGRRCGSCWKHMIIISFETHESYPVMNSIIWLYQR
jgi:nucleoside-diphosphate-sugar epimerase